jgi:hypothetical protein
MSNRILTSAIAAGRKLPLTAGRLDFIQNNTEQITSTIIKGLLGTYTTNDVIILYGCVFTGTDPGARTMTAGAIYYNGLVYQVPSASFTTTGSNIPLWTLVTTSSDLATFSDGFQINVDQVQTFVLVPGPSGGSGITGYIVDYNSATVKAMLPWNNGNSTTGFSFASPSPMTVNAFVYQWRISGNSAYFEYTLNITAGNTATPLSIIAPLPFNKKQKITNQPDHNLIATQNGALIYAKAITSSIVAANQFSIQSPVAVVNGDVFVFTGSFIVEI